MSELYSSGLILKDIAEQFGVCTATAHVAVKRFRSRRSSARATGGEAASPIVVSAEKGTDLHKLEVLQTKLFALVEAGSLSASDWQKVSASLIATTDSLVKHRAIAGGTTKDTNADDAGQRVREKLKRLAAGAKVALVGVEAEGPGASAVNE